MYTNFLDFEHQHAEVIKLYSYNILPVLNYYFGKYFLNLNNILRTALIFITISRERKRESKKNTMIEYVYIFLHRFAKDFQDSSWVFICEEETRLDLSKLMEVLVKYEPNKV